MDLPRSVCAQKAQGQEMKGCFGGPVKISEPPPLGLMTLPQKLTSLLEPCPDDYRAVSRESPVATPHTRPSPAELGTWLPASPQAPREAAQPTRACEAPMMVLIC